MSTLQFDQSILKHKMLDGTPTNYPVSLSCENFQASYQIGDTIIHPGHGGCVIDAISPREIDGTPEDFYTLRPIVNSNITVFIPVRLASEIGLRNVICSDDARGILSSIPEMKTNWVKESIPRKRAYSAIVKNNDLMELTRLVKTFAHQKVDVKISASDQSIFDLGKKKLISELALSLEKTYENMESLFYNIVASCI